MTQIDLSFDETQADSFKRAITRGSGAEGMAIAHRLSMPSYNADGSIQMSVADKIGYLANLSPQELESTINGARQYLEMEHSISRRYAEQYAQMPRRRSAAPAPFRAPRGGASPPKNLETLAAKENPKDYIAMRHAQMKREER
jgi:hypothetical protein